MLNNHERDFLAAFIYEATTDPFSGPATKDLQRHGIFYADIPNLLAAYYQEHNPNQDGLGGRMNLAPPPCPWVSKEAAQRRDQDLAAALVQG